MKYAFYADYIYFNSEIHSNSWLLVDGNIITGITDSISNLDNYNQKVFKNSAIFPGLINTHTHLAMSAFRGYGDDLSLMDWLKNHIWPAEKKFVSSEFVYDYTLLSLAESIRSGVTCVNDMYFYGNDVARAIKDSGIRGVIAFGIMDSLKSLKAAQNFKQNDFIKVSIAPHSLYSVNIDIFKESLNFAKDNNFIFHTHLSETKSENEEILSKYNKTPIQLMNDTGAFDYPLSIFAHCVHLLDDEIILMGSKNVNISHCLESNFKLASGFAPIKKLIDAGANISIGTDGAASNNDQSMINEMSSVSKFHKALNYDAECLSAECVLNMATKNAAKTLNFNKIGELKEGNYADFFVLSFDSVSMTPIYSPISQLIYSANSNDVTDVYVNGRPVLSDRKILLFDEEKIKEIARNKAKKIKGN